jgi:hypothetical protein
VYHTQQAGAQPAKQKDDARMCGAVPLLWLPSHGRMGLAVRPAVMMMVMMMMPVMTMMSRLRRSRDACAQREDEGQ